MSGTGGGMGGGYSQGGYGQGGYGQSGGGYGLGSQFRGPMPKTGGGMSYGPAYRAPFYQSPTFQQQAPTYQQQAPNMQQFSPQQQAPVPDMQFSQATPQAAQSGLLPQAPSIPSYDGINDPAKRDEVMANASKFFQSQGPQNYIKNMRAWQDGAPITGGGIDNGSMAPLGRRQNPGSGDQWLGDHWASQGAKPTTPMANGQAGWQFDVNGKQWIPQYTPEYLQRLMGGAV